MAEAISPTMDTEQPAADNQARSQLNQPAPLSGMPLAIVTFALSMAVFMMVLDSTIANVALPTIAGDLGAATSQGTWVITMFAVSNAISIPLTGWLARQYGSVKVLSKLSNFLCK